VSGYVLSPAAVADLEAIWAFGEGRWGPEQAEDYMRRLQGAIETVARDPRRGRACDEIRPGYRKFAAGAHMIFYRLHPAGADIVRILHSTWISARIPDGAQPPALPDSARRPTFGP
jgi:toxin ParE1/3/4